MTADKDAAPPAAPSAPARLAPWARRALWLLPALAILVGAYFGAGWVEDRAALRGDIKARERLTLYRETILRELEKFRYLPHVLARDPRAVGVLSAPERAASTNRFLKDLAAITGAEALYIMDGNGRTVAASNFDTATSFIGSSYGFRPYFRAAIKGEEGQFFAVGATTGIPGMFFARATPEGAPAAGVVVVKVNMDRLERSWRDGGETVFVSDVHGVVFLGSRDDWRYASIAPLSDMVVAAIRANQQYGGVPLRALQDGPPAAEVLRIGGAGYRQARLKVGLLDWTIHYLTPMAQVRAPRALVWTGAVALLLVYLIAALVVRSQRLRRQSAGLRRFNRRLVEEIEERRRVETELREAQAGLARASRLAAVGEMSAAVSHELNQPLAALRMFVSGSRVFLERGDLASVQENLGEIDALQARMAALTQELKRFARPGESRVERVDLRDCLRTSAKLIRPRIEETGVPLDLSLPETPMLAATAPLRVEQVLVNLLRNAIDACQAAPAPRVSARGWIEEGLVRIEIADNGDGVPAELRERIFEPYFSTKPAASGLGLGLAISARIVEDLGGTLSLHESAAGGAAFVLALPVAPPLTGTEPGEKAGEAEYA
ncbi:two-component sensor histidine kinase [Stappia taiwanensis]|nr:two-component sensor histidine kinase [Stappia taiwanensis]